MDGMDTVDEIEKRKAEPWRLKLKEAIDVRRWNYNHLSIEAGFSKNYISKMLNGRINPTVDKIQRICEVADIEMSSLFGEPVDSDLVNEVVEKTAQLSEKEARLVVRLLENLRAE